MLAIAGDGGDGEGSGGTNQHGERGCRVYNQVFQFAYIDSYERVYGVSIFTRIAIYTV